MKRTAKRFAASAAALLLSLSVWAPSAFAAAPLRGQLRLPRGFRPITPNEPTAFWPDLRNALLPIAPPLVDPRRHMIVSLEGNGSAASAAIRPLIVMSDARFSPPVIAVRPGTEVRFVNRDWMLHLIEPRKGDFMKAKSLSPGDDATQRFDKAGTYVIHCSEAPQMVATILVVDKPRLALPTDNGSFRFANVPPGTYTLRVWYAGSWIHTQPVSHEKGGDAIEVTLPRDPAKAAGRKGK